MKKFLTEVLRWFVASPERKPAKPLQPRTIPLRRREQHALSLLLSVLCASWSPGAPAPRRSFQIPAGDAAVTLKRFSDQSGEQIIFPVDLVRGVRTNAVEGAMSAREALDRLVANTGLVVIVDVRTGAITVSRPGKTLPEGPPRAAPRATVNPPAPPAISAPMKSRTLLSAVAGWLAVSFPPPVEGAQAAATDPEIIQLSPFNVTSAKDTGYTAANSLAGGRLTSPLQEMPSSVSVLTREFLDDIAATDLLTAANYFPNAVSGNPASMNDYAVSLRGFPSGFLYRNFFISYVNPDSYVTERLDSARGPNALVFGDTKAGGTLNLSTKQAKFRNFAQLSYRFNSEGGFGRTTGDANLKLSDKVAVRAGVLYQDENDWVDFTYIRRQGAYATTTWVPFRNTTVRLEAERYRQNQSSPWLGSVLRDNLGLWDGVTGYTAANQTIVTGSGTSRVGANYKVFMPGTGLNVVDWTGWGQTAGTGYQLDTYRPAHLPSTVPTLPYRGYNIRLGDGNDVEMNYRTAALFVEQKVGDRLFLEVAGNFARQKREQYQLAAEGVSIDVNRNLPSGATNPNFGRRYTETGQFSFTTQQNTLYEARATAAYLTRLGTWSEHRLLLGTGYRRDAYRDYTKQVMLDVPGARFQNPFANPNALRLRIYEQYRGIEQQLPTGVKQGLWNFFPGEDKDLYSGQFAASSKWFDDRRLVTLLGVRHDKLRKKATVARVDPVTGEFVEYLERYIGPAAPGLSGAGSLQEFKPVITRTAGAVYKLVNWLSPYAAYSEGYDTSNVGFLLDPVTGIPNAPLPAKESKGQEFGVKFTLLENRLAGSIGWYRNEQTNDNNTGVTFPRNEINALWNVVDNVATSPRQIPTGPAEVIDYQGTGIELELTANLTRHWRAMFNLSFPDTERQGGYNRTIEYYNRNRPEWQRTLDTLVATNDARATTFRNNLQAIDSRIASVANGLPLSGTLKYTANLFTSYEFATGALRGLRVGGGANLRGDRYLTYQQRIANDPRSFQRLDTRGYAIFSFTAGYRTKVWERPVNFQLNVENLFDEQFKRYTAFNTVTTSTGEVVFNGNNYGLQAPRRFILSADVRF
ncbi:MAG: TonB-dependent receptor [Verrucomicrobia bacterium]|nr:TonB-dependent receptor [Verrucomicrobiota bacterium]